MSVGQTYYFSVHAVNGVGLTGSATNSNGQTVVSSATTYFSDNFENWTVHGGAWSSVSGENVNHSLNTSTDFARSGTKSLKLTDNDTTAVYGACLVKNFSPTIAGNVYVRFYVYLPSALCFGQRQRDGLATFAASLVRRQSRPNVDLCGCQAADGGGWRWGISVSVGPVGGCVALHRNVHGHAVGEHGDAVLG